MVRIQFTLQRLKKSTGRLRPCRRCLSLSLGNPVLCHCFSFKQRTVDGRAIRQMSTHRKTTAAFLSNEIAIHQPMVAD
jgi:hypothetical protein